MVLRDFTDLAALMIRHAPHVIENDAADPTRMAEAFWVYSRRRKTRWFQDCETTNASPDLWAGLAEEFFVSDVLARSWAGIVLATAERHRCLRARGLVVQALGWQLEIRNRLLKELDVRWEESNGRAALLDILRRRTERWADLLLSPLIPRYRVDDACFSVERAFDSSATYEQTRWRPGYEGLWTLTAAALRASMPTHPVAPSRVKSYSDFIDGILSAVPATAFGSDGTIRSERLRRLFQTTRETIPTRHGIRRVPQPR